MDDIIRFETFYVDVTGKDAQGQIADALVRDGIATFDTIHSKEELLTFCTMLGTIVKHRDADKTGLTQIVKWDGPLPKDGYLAFSSSCLTLHTDGSSLPEPATLVILWCEQPAEKGGTSILVDGKYLYQVLAKQYPRVLEELAAPNSASFAGADTLFKSAVFSTHKNGNICIRFRYDTLGYFAAPVSAVLPTFLQLLNQLAIHFTLQKHQGFIIQNGRWLHGRTAFDGYRKMWRALIQMNDNMLFGRKVDIGFNVAS